MTATTVMTQEMTSGHRTEVALGAHGCLVRVDRKKVSGVSVESRPRKEEALFG